VPDENPSSLGNFELALRFPGQYADKGTNLSYNMMRDYDPALGAYKQSDPIGLRGGLHTYGYVFASPLSYSDPLGLVPNPAEAACAVGPNPVCISGLAADVLTSLAGLAGGAAIVAAANNNNSGNNKGRINDPQAQAEHDQYKTNYNAPPPPFKDPCDELRWKLKREEDFSITKKSLVFWRVPRPQISPLRLGAAQTISPSTGISI
jgi:RHS repeat-associated protein